MLKKIESKEEPKQSGEGKTNEKSAQQFFAVETVVLLVREAPGAESHVDEMPQGLVRRDLILGVACLFYSKLKSQRRGQAIRLLGTGFEMCPEYG